MKRAWMVAGAVAVFLPTVFVAWLLLAAGWSKMDPLTMRLPESARSLAVRAMLGQMSDAQTLERAKKIDAAAATEWQSRPRMGFDRSNSFTVDNRNSELRAKRAADLNKIGLQQEKAGRQCQAEEIFSQAASASSGGYYYSPAEHMGRTALRCGDLGSARAGLETAVLKEGKSLKDDDADDIKETNADMLKDREYLVVVYERQHEAALVAATCKQAHTGWKGCDCGLDAKGDVQCREKR